MCGTCSPATCTCPGVGSCSKCRLGEVFPGDLAAIAGSSDDTPQLRALTQEVVFAVQDQTLRVEAGEAPRQQSSILLARRLLGNIAENLTVACFGGAEKTYNL